MKKYLIPLSTVCLLVTACSSTQKLVIMKQDKHLSSCYEKKTPELQTCFTKLATNNNIPALAIISQYYKNGTMGFKHDEKKGIVLGQKILS